MTSSAAAADSGAPPTLLYQIKQVELAVRARLDELTRPWGLTALQYTALTVLERRPQLTSAELARRSFVTAQTMADMVTSLTRRGLIKRQRDVSDRRLLVIDLTAAGERLLARLRPEVEALEGDTVSLLSAAEIANLGSALERCRQALDVAT